MTIKIKICGVKDIQTAQLSKDLGADMIGLVFAESKRQINIATAASIVRSVGTPLRYLDLAQPPPLMKNNAFQLSEWFLNSHKILDSYLLNKKPLTVGVFAKQSIKEINQIAEATDIDIVQLSGNYSLEDALSINRQTFFSIGILPDDNESKLLKKIQSGFSLSLIFDSFRDSNLGGTGEAFNWDLLYKINLQIPFILAGGLNINNVELAISELKPWGVDVSSGVEENGQKNHKLIEEFINKVRNSE
ncbi:MAG: phosphoribosylanthranilate isomerase [Dehalococcoidia bacterium]|nr:phosphoribosylanthranilate isomerase [Dehalococcoidia bacterium]